MFKDVCLFDELEGGKLSRVCMVCTAKRRVRHAQTPRPVPHPERSMHMNPTREFPGVDIDRVHHLRGAVTRRKR